ncbi:hypothetical protein IT072_06755 [Leifsonia sp. ZF2019]|nr:hypothetical protein IT072_06755 [Leifsonia sp. ZF2019]
MVSDTEVRVYFVAGIPDCYGTRAVVSETSTTIAVTVMEGVIPGAPDECELVARQASLLVRTSRSIGGRTIVAG